MKTTIILSATLVVMTAISAHAIDGYDGDNNRIPGQVGATLPETLSPVVYAQAPVQARAPRGVFPKHEKRLFKRAQGLTD